MNTRMKDQFGLQGTRLSRMMRRVPATTLPYPPNCAYSGQPLYALIISEPYIMEEPDTRNTALLLIDLQNEPGTSDVPNMETILNNATLLINACREAGIPIIYTRHINRADAIGVSDGEPLDDSGRPVYYNSHSENIKISAELPVSEKDIIVDKHRYSGFFESSLEMVLKSLDVKHLLLGGVLTDVCVLTTAFDAYARNYQVNLIKDICGSTSEGSHMSSVVTMANWIYDINVYDTNNLIKKIQKKDHYTWKSKHPDSLGYSARQLKETYEKL